MKALMDCKNLDFHPGGIAGENRAWITFVLLGKMTGLVPDISSQKYGS